MPGSDIKFSKEIDTENVAKDLKSETNQRDINIKQLPGDSGQEVTTRSVIKPQTEDLSKIDMETTQKLGDAAKKVNTGSQSQNL